MPQVMLKPLCLQSYDLLLYDVAADLRHCALIDQQNTVDILVPVTSSFEICSTAAPVLCLLALSVHRTLLSKWLLNVRFV
ncbi:hypothetical protein T02_2300 [Trichinella nativa]|uniref:Uncharacterized protein n=1 Tax=Trichinella nativa TaxID=6335 RepID=A0A0V1KUI6_9BILA|nr:hypothetical protein T02_2300 [Trichinella nativa]